jgi:hypothetical protein
MTKSQCSMTNQIPIFKLIIEAWDLYWSLGFGHWDFKKIIGKNKTPHERVLRVLKNVLSEDGTISTFYLISSVNGLPRKSLLFKNFFLQHPRYTRSSLMASSDVSKS